MFTDPLSVTYNGSAKSLPRTRQDRTGTVYKTADGEFEVYINQNPPNEKTGIMTSSIKLARRIPDPTPSDPFDPWREERNAFGISYQYDVTRNQASTDHPLLRTALLALVDSTFYGRLIAGEM